LSRSNVYLILDRDVADYDRLLSIALDAVQGGVDIFQIRDKNGRLEDIIEFSKAAIKILRNKALFIINDRIDAALASGADGVHLGQEDITLKAARQLMPYDKIIGISCQTLPQAQEAQKEGADYIGFGSVFKTLTKPQRQPMDLDLLSDVAIHIKIPVFAIGGITQNNIDLVKGTGVSKIAVCRAVCHAEDVKAAAESFKALMN